MSINQLCKIGWYTSLRIEEMSASSTMHRFPFFQRDGFYVEKVSFLSVYYNNLIILLKISFLRKFFPQNILHRKSRNSHVDHCQQWKCGQNAVCIYFFPTTQFLYPAAERIKQVLISHIADDRDNRVNGHA